MSIGIKVVLAVQVIFACAVTLTKLSMLMLTRRITFACATGLWYSITTTAIIVVSIQGMVFCLAVVFQCRYVLSAFSRYL